MIHHGGRISSALDFANSLMKNPLFVDTLISRQESVPVVDAVPFSMGGFDSITGHKEKTKKITAVERVSGASERFLV